MYRKHFSRLFESAPERQKWTSSRHSTHHAAGSRVRHLGLRRTEVRGLQEKQPARTEASNHRLLGKISVRKDQGLTYVRGKREASAFRGPEHKAVLLRLFSRQVFPDGLKYLRTRHCDLLPYLFVLRPVESLQGQPGLRYTKDKLCIGLPGRLRVLHLHWSAQRAQRVHGLRCLRLQVHTLCQGQVSVH